jgi:uncharacterized OB-fold protein
MSERPLPVEDADSRPFWEACRAHRLQVQRCSACGHYRWPPRGLCPKCHSWDFAWQTLNGQGTVASFVVVHQATPAFADMAPYTIARIALDGTDDAVLLTSNLVESEEPRVGQRVEVVFDASGLPLFRAL